MSHTFIILDAHPTAFTPTLTTYQHDIPPTHQLPPFPLWACMVEGTIEHCRTIWDICGHRNHLVTVITAARSPTLLNRTAEQSIQVLEQTFPHVQPRETCNTDRLQPAIELALSTFMKKNDKNDHTLHRCRLMVLSISKDDSEKLFEFHNNPGEPPRDIRALAFTALQNVRKKYPQFRIDHIDVDVLRLLTHTSSQQEIPSNIISREVSQELAVSVYNIPNGQYDLKYTMQNLIRLYYNINLLNITNIPMKSGGESQSTHTVSLYYQSKGSHLVNQPPPNDTLPIYHPDYLKSRDLNLIYLKRSKRALPETEWCTCMHTISPYMLHDQATKVYLDMTSKGSISHLMTPEATQLQTSTHFLMSQNDRISLHCINNQKRNHFETIAANMMEIVEVKMEDAPYPMPVPKRGDTAKTQEFLETLIKPNVFNNINDFHSRIADPLCQLISINPFRYAYHLPSIYQTIQQERTCKTIKSIEKASRWRTCFRDSEGTDKVHLRTCDTRSIKDLSLDVLNGVPVGSGFGIALGLIHDLIEQLQDVFMKDDISSKDLLSTEKLIDMILSGLVNALEGSRQTLFIKGLPKEDARLLAMKLLIALYIVGKRFSKDSDNHRKLCRYMMDTIDEKTATRQIEESMDSSVTENPIESSWNQLGKYENMSLREKEEASQGYNLEVKHEMSNPHMNRPSESNNKGRAVNTSSWSNPHFRHRRGNNPNTHNNNNNNYNNNMRKSSIPLKYPDASVAIPYLNAIPPTLEEKAHEEAAEEESLGNPGNLLRLYWTNDKVKRRGNLDEGDLDDGSELVYKNKEWKRIRKEFDGRIAQPGEKGETI
ncbi:hypothetical protein BDB01DRAFT_808108 [Pilobolus umbonatus]|nr:hypothetical protein BDB01DRAFT_808108 [Pilobolus umbonatus]